MKYIAKGTIRKSNDFNIINTITVDTLSWMSYSSATSNSMPAQGHTKHHKAMLAWYTQHTNTQLLKLLDAGVSKHDEWHVIVFTGKLGIQMEWLHTQVLNFLNKSCFTKKTMWDLCEGTFCDFYSKSFIGH